MPKQMCPECGGSMVFSRKADRPGDEPPTPTTGEDLEVEQILEIAAEDPAEAEKIMPSGSTVVCSRCGHVTAAPQI